MYQRQRRPQEEIDKVLHAFLTEKDNTTKRIAELTGMKVNSVCSIINRYLKSKEKEYGITDIATK